MDIDFGLSYLTTLSSENFSNDFDFDFLTQYLLFDDDNDNVRSKLEGIIGHILHIYLEYYLQRII